MRIVEVDNQPFHELAYDRVAPGRRVESAQLPFLGAWVDELPPGLSAIIAASDLQGREHRAAAQGSPRLLGEVLAEELSVAGELGMVPPLDRVGVVLAGDLFSRSGLERRGGMGDARPVWRAFARTCWWVTGVAGNHDCFGEKPSVPDFSAFCREPGINFLDGGFVGLDGLRIGGLSGIIGPPRKPFRRLEDDYVSDVTRLAAQPLDLLVLHDGPDVDGADLRGWRSVRVALEVAHQILVVRGHAHWEGLLATLVNGTQVLNVDSRVVVLQEQE